MTEPTPDPKPTTQLPPPPAWPPPPPAPAAKRRRGLRIGLAAAAIGAVVGAGAAAPITWAVLEAQQTRASEGTADIADRPDGRVPEGDPAPYRIPGGTTGGFEAASDQESTGVVLIDVESGQARGAGTGWVLDGSGTVVTNYHVVAGSTRITVTDPATGEEYDATVVGRDEEDDVALLELAGSPDLTPVTLDDDDDPAVGDEVTAVGNAQGQGSLSASDGTVVALEQDIATTDRRNGTRHPLDGLIETDAYVVGGFSGGVLLDDEGEVVGITTAASAGGPTESYAVPIDDALEVVDQIEAGDESDGVEIGPAAYLGITVDGSAPQVRVVGVERGGPAAGAGIVAGDVITRVAGTRVGSLSELQDVLAGKEPGDRVAVRWTDGRGRSHDATVTLGESPVN